MAIHHLKANEHTVRIGLIDQAHPPVLEVNDGDQVDVETWGMWGNAVTPETTYEEVLALRGRFSGRGPHSLTGPILVNGARKGMALRIQMLSLQVGSHGFNLMPPRETSRGLLADDFQQGSIRHFHLDSERMEARFSKDIVLPLRPFFGIIGVAPEAPGAHSSTIPGVFGGNIDCPELTVGSTLYLPVWVDGGLLYAGDAHAMQGCGEVNQTALETSMKNASLKIDVMADMHINRPLAETGDSIITMGFDKDLHEAARQATRDMSDYLVRNHDVNFEEAYRLCSLQGDLFITQAVNRVNGVHMRFPKNILPAQTG